jgi:hypothetical protein
MALDRIVNTQPTIISRIRNSLTSRFATFFTAAAFTLASCGDVASVGCKDDYGCKGKAICNTVEQICEGPNKEQYCEDDFDCYFTICDQNICVPENSINNNEDPKIEVTNVGSVKIKSGKTNDLGRILFNDDQSNLDFYVEIKNENSGSLLSNANVTFVDGNFNTFFVEKEGFVSYFDAYTNLSQKSDWGDTLKFMFSLNPSNHTDFTVWDSYFEENSGKINAMEDYVSWSENNYKYINCMTKEEMKEARERTSEIISSVSGWKVISTAYEKMMKLEEWGLIEYLPDDVYHIYEPMNFSGPGLAKGAPLSPENCYNYIDDDCSGLVDSADPACEICEPNMDFACHDGAVYWIDSCGEWGNQKQGCFQGEDCINGTCQGHKEECGVCNEDSDCEVNWFCMTFPDSELLWGYCAPESTCSSDSQCDKGYVCYPTNHCGPEQQKVCYQTGVWVEDSCGGMMGKIKDCWGNNFCSNGECVDGCPDNGEKVCYDGDVYDSNACGQPLTKEEECGNEGCSNGSCGGGGTIDDFCNTGTQDCVEVTVSISDNGVGKDDSYKLEVNGQGFGTTPIGGSKNFGITMVNNTQYNMAVTGMGIPDGVGTYLIGLNKAIVISGPSFFGDDLDAGVTKNWTIKAKK